MKLHKASNAVTDGIVNIRDRISDVADQANDHFDAARSSTAGTLHVAARNVRQGGDVVSDAAQSTARRLVSSARYLESRDARRMLGDLAAAVRKHPGRSALIAGVIGFFVARALRSRDT